MGPRSFGETIFLCFDQDQTLNAGDREFLKITREADHGHAPLVSFLDYTPETAYGVGLPVVVDVDTVPCPDD
jgi:hypothetical protein